MCILNCYTKKDTLGFVLVNLAHQMLYVTGSVHFIAHLACNLSIRHAKHTRLLTTAKDYTNEMA